MHGAPAKMPSFSPDLWGAEEILRIGFVGDGAVQTRGDFLNKAAGSKQNFLNRGLVDGGDIASLTEGGRLEGTH
jgi:hypothetical protein